MIVSWAHSSDYACVPRRGRGVWPLSLSRHYTAKIVNAISNNNRTTQRQPESSLVRYGGQRSHSQNPIFPPIPSSIGSSLFTCSVSALKLVVNHWLHACLNACDVVSHGIHASLCGVDLDDALKLGLASLKLILPEFALGLAIFNHLFFGVLSLLEHLFNIA